MFPWLQAVARHDAGKGGVPSGGPARWSATYRVMLARKLNAACGSTVLTAWNIGEIPSEDINEILNVMKWEQELKDYYGR